MLILKTWHYDSTLCHNNYPCAQPSKKYDGTLTLPCLIPNPLFDNPSFVAITFVFTLFGVKVFILLHLKIALDEISEYFV